MAPTDELPVAVFAYNRPQLLERTLACLREAGAGLVHVLSDGPRGPEDEPLVAEVRRIARAARWRAGEVLERDDNAGGTRATLEGMAWLFERHDRVVVIEDDIAVAPEFLRYAAAALDRYEHEPGVGGITGLRLPFSRRPLRRWPYDAFLLPRFFTWSWATWRHAWESWELDPERVLERLRRERPPLERAGADLPYMVRTGLVERVLAEPWDVCVAASMVLQGQHFVVPAWNMVENTGMDSGQHPHDVPWTLRWELEHRPDGPLRLPPPVVDEAILRSFHVFRENPRGWTTRRLVPRPLRAALRRVRGTYDVFRDSSES